MFWWLWADYEQCEFASAKTNGIEKYGEDLEKMKMNGPGKWKLG